MADTFDESVLNRLPQVTDPIYGILRSSLAGST